MSRTTWDKTAKFWRVPKIWNKERGFILGGGPSLIGTDLCLGGLSSALKGENVICVNNTFHFVPWAQVLFFGDAKFYWWNREDIQKFEGLKVTTNIYVEGREESLKGEKNILILKRGQTRGINIRDRSSLAWNRSSGACAVNLAILLGLTEIYLLGYDMRNVNGRKNAIIHEKEKTNQDPYDFMIGTWPHMHAEVSRLTKAKIYNATPESALDVFPKVNIREVLR